VLSVTDGMIVRVAGSPPDSTTRSRTRRTRRWRGGGERVDVSRSLARQSMLVAVVAAVLDTTLFVISGIFGVAPWPAVAVVAGIIAADLALAATSRTAGAVALAQVLLRLASVSLLCGHGLPVRGAADIGFPVAGYRAGAWLSGAASVWAVATLTMGAAGIGLITGGAPVRDPWPLVATAVADGALPWLVGRYTAARGAYIADLEQRARLRRQEHQAALDLALADEREAIARDLHDVISHHVSAIGIHAGAARLALAADPAAATASLAAVETASRAAMVDLRRQLDLLHGRDQAGNRQPGLADIEELVAHVREAGLEVEIVTAGSTGPLPESLDVTVFRIVQEVLTNALRHGGGTAHLAVTCTADHVLIEQSNAVGGYAGSVESLHRGLDGIRRRTELFGGTVDYGVAGDRWHIRVSLPIGGA
jgi:signal transduction histidine kinase